MTSELLRGDDRVTSGDLVAYKPSLCLSVSWLSFVVLWFLDLDGSSFTPTLMILRSFRNSSINNRISL